MCQIAWVAGVAVSASVACFGTAGAVELPYFQELKASHRSSLTAVLDRRGENIAYVRSDLKSLQLEWTALEDFSPALVSMVLRSEDQDFVQHWGVDFSALLAALKQTSQGQKRGASTITMQLVGLLDTDLQRKSGQAQRTVGQKLAQASAALWLERRWSKAQILETYLNKVPLTGELVGLSAASRAMFGKAPHGLNLEDSAIMAALLRAPNAQAVAVAKRACALTKASSCELMEGRVRIALAQAKKPELVPRAIAGHYARHVVRASPSQTGIVRTSIDARLQRLANDALQRHLRELSARQVEDGAALVLDRVSGEVLAWIGSSGSLSDAAQVDFVLAKRQAGSTLKPVLYAQAIEEKRLTAASLLDDRPLNLNTASGLYVPRNYEQQYVGPVPVRAALASSLNIPAVRVAVMLTPEKIFQTLSGLGFKLRESGGYFGYSLALGSAEVSLLELAKAYRQLSLLDATSAGLSPGSKFIVGDILADANARSLTFGLHSPLSTRGWAAVKTGTSKDMRDNWCVGFTDRYVVAAWVGNASGEPMHKVSGVTGAAPIWAEIVAALHRDQVSRAPLAPASLAQRQVAFEGTALHATQAEWFIKGTESALTKIAATSAEAPRITHPVSGTILALDPDIPPARQRLVLRSNLVDTKLSWRVDDRPMQGNLWLPQPGRHQISLHEAQGQLVEKVWVEVRGAQAKGVAEKPTNTDKPTNTELPKSLSPHPQLTKGGSST